VVALNLLMDQCKIITDKTINAMAINQSINHQSQSIFHIKKRQMHLSLGTVVVLVELSHKKKVVMRLIVIYS
jgi:hypothetical protein